MLTKLLLPSAVVTLALAAGDWGCEQISATSADLMATNGRYKMVYLCTSEYDDWAASTTPSGLGSSGGGYSTAVNPNGTFTHTVEGTFSTDFRLSKVGNYRMETTFTRNGHTVSFSQDLAFCPGLSCYDFDFSVIAGAPKVIRVKGNGTDSAHAFLDARVGMAADDFERTPFPFSIHCSHAAVKGMSSEAACRWFDSKVHMWGSRNPRVVPGTFSYRPTPAEVGQTRSACFTFTDNVDIYAAQYEEVGGLLLSTDPRTACLNVQVVGEGGQSTAAPGTTTTSTLAPSTTTSSTLAPGTSTDGPGTKTTTAQPDSTTTVEPDTPSGALGISISCTILLGSILALL